MPRRPVLSTAERDNLLSFPDSEDDLIRNYTFSEADLPLICQRRGAPNRLGFATQFCYMRVPGIMLAVGDAPPPALLAFVARQLGVAPMHWEHRWTARPDAP
nr:DUF4158 domain-containing protein [Paraburkholderia madseniana]